MHSRMSQLAPGGVGRVRTMMSACAQSSRWENVGFFLPRMVDTSRERGRTWCFQWRSNGSLRMEAEAPSWRVMRHVNRRTPENSPKSGQRPRSLGYLGISMVPGCLDYTIPTAVYYEPRTTEIVVCKTGQVTARIVSAGLLRNSCATVKQSAHEKLLTSKPSSSTE
jgi:hypothetical protein